MQQVLNQRFALNYFSRIFQKMGVLEPIKRIHWSKPEQTAWCITTTGKIITVFLEDYIEIFLETNNELYIYYLSDRNEPTMVSFLKNAC